MTLDVTPPVGPSAGSGGSALTAPRDETDPAFERADHRVAERHRWPWLPIRARGTLAPHPYCADCGLVKFVGGDRARDIGGLANLVGRLSRTLEERGHKVTEAQTRLIMLRLEHHDVGDTFTLSREQQLALVAEIVGPILGLTAHAADTYLRSC